MNAPYHERGLKYEKRTIVPKPKIIPTRGKKKSIKAKICGCERSSLFLKEMGKMEK